PDASFTDPAIADWPSAIPGIPAIPTTRTSAGNGLPADRIMSPPISDGDIAREPVMWLRVALCPLKRLTVQVVFASYLTTFRDSPRPRPARDAQGRDLTRL